MLGLDEIAWQWLSLGRERGYCPVVVVIEARLVGMRDRVHVATSMTDVLCMLSCRPYPPQRQANQACDHVAGVSRLKAELESNLRIIG